MTEEISTQILDAAEARFRTYGFGKTTMAEIASDIDMSTANLYRYFENKMAIGSAMAERCICDRETILKEVVSRQGITESTRLKIFVLAMLNYGHSQVSNEPKMSELIDIIIKKRADIVQQQVKTDNEFISTILQQGCDSEEFAIENVAEMAGYVQAAIVKFSSPFFINMFPIEELERLAKGVVLLILNGLVKK
ncbi:MAG: TetR/AcrR family transcriptional regulator [Gammaproteobacteria bacterium]|nr:TetR/AcrR family transcriptional regulator [Gammaproteobacteria bacterium]MCW8987776.1 TetR/AcrR family transcriptional regulator [Gammaproteobacteria bacterium]MCW9029886.1 TetR/AcrR family transcriptional regulator [Gammaproteobacteria bacterium]